jgi:hypothetical protein
MHNDRTCGGLKRNASRKINSPKKKGGMSDAPAAAAEPAPAAPAAPVPDTTPAAVPTQPAAGKAAKMGKNGCVEVNVIEVRDIKCAFVTVQCEVIERTTKVKRKNEQNAKFDEFFSM